MTRWGCPCDALDPYNDDENRSFNTPVSWPKPFILELAKRCPEGHWVWYFDTEDSREHIFDIRFNEIVPFIDWDDADHEGWQDPYDKDQDPYLKAEAGSAADAAAEDTEAKAEEPKTAAKKASAKKATAKKTAAAKDSEATAEAPKAAAKKAPTKKTTAKKTSAAKDSKAPAKKTAAKKTSTAKATTTTKAKKSE